MKHRVRNGLKHTFTLAALAAVAIAAMLFSGCAQKEEPVIRRDISGDTPYYKTILFANDSANQVQSWYTDAARTGLHVENAVMSFETGLSTAGKNGMYYFANSAGANYFTDSMDMYLLDRDGVEWTDRNSLPSARVNTRRLGYYYYEVNVEDHSVGLADVEKSILSDPVPLTDFGETYQTNMVELTQKQGKYVSVKLQFPTDAYFYLNGIDIPKAQASTVRVTAKVKGKCRTAKFYYYDKTTRMFNSSQCITFSLENDGKEHTYYLDISGGLQDDLTCFRLEFQGEKGDVVTVSEMNALMLGTTPDVRVDKIYHVFPDKLHQELRFYGAEEVKDFTGCGLVWKLPESSVDALQIRDKDGIHNDLDFNAETVEYVGFHIKNAGVVGLIIPEHKSNTKAVTVELTDGFYVVRQQYNGVMRIPHGGWIKICNRLYNDASADFAGIDRESRIERNPLTSITVVKHDSDCRYAGYDEVSGVYTFAKNGTDFSTAYYLAQNRYFSSQVSVTNDTEEDRTVYFRFNGASGALENAVLLDEKGESLLPVPVQVCKNFTGEFEDAFYDPNDTGYGDSYFPMVISAGETAGFTEMHLYQNWGKFPLKQLSSIQFFVSYYHLSVGISETNCIAPYFVYGKDGWILPDFRGISGHIWGSQPQFNATGVTKVVSFKDGDGYLNQSEYTGSRINSSGPTYADLEYSYISDDGSFEYTLRHTEFPQTDENRTYYTLELNFLKKLTLDNVREDLTLLMFNSRNVAFHTLSYLGEGGTKEDLDMALGTVYTGKYAKLAKGSFWYTWHFITEPSWADPMNYGVVVRDYSCRIGGKAWNGNFLVRCDCDGVYNSGYLTLDLGKTTFRKGDRITMRLVLLPWGNDDLQTTENIEKVYEDSVLAPMTVSASVGSVVEEPWLPHVKALDNVSEFTVTGGRDNIVVRVDGFTVPARPTVYKLTGGEWALYDTSEEGVFDGYMTHFCEDGTYGFSFVFTQEDPAAGMSFRVAAAGETPAAN